MKVIATIQADLDVTPLGTRSRLTDELVGVTVLRRTVQRVCLAKCLEAVYVLCPAGQRERCEALLVGGAHPTQGTGATVRPYDARPAPWGALVQTARKWSLGGWRGGIGGTTHFDEFTDVGLLSGLLGVDKADAILSVPAAAPLIDPPLIERMIEHHRETGDDIQLTFTQAPPGLAGLVLDASLVHQLADKSIPVGWLFSFQPDNPQKDLIFQPCCYDIPSELRYAVGRLTADTDRSMERLAALLREHDAPDLVTVGRWLGEREQASTEPLPREVEIELTTDDPYPRAMLRPAGDRVDTRGPIEPAIVHRIVTEITRYDDALLTLGGFGDPLRHPQFAAILESIRSVRRDGRSLYGLAVRTRAADLTDEHIDAMISNEVDILNVTLEAWTPQLYGKLQSPDDPAAADLEAVLRKLDRLSDFRQQRKTVKPILVPEMTKAYDNVQELDAFHDGWLRRAGAVCISGYSHYARQCEDRSVIRMAPSTRVGCRRIHSRCLVLADGQVTLCDQDFNGRHAIGRLGDMAKRSAAVQHRLRGVHAGAYGLGMPPSLEQIWRSEAFERVREAHRQGRFDPTPLCAACEEWHRP